MSPPPKWPDILVLGLVAAVALGPFVLDLDLTLEDGYYYLGVARHLAAGHGSTFDGLHPTNGYHPLWLLVLVPLFALAGDAGAALRGGHLVQGLLIVAAAVLLLRAARRLSGGVTAPLVVLVWSGLTFRFWWCGLEFALYVFCLALVLELYLRPGVRGPGPGVRGPGVRGLTPGFKGSGTAFGGAGALAVLARLDAVIVVGTVLAAVLFYLLRSSPRGGWRRAAWTVGPVILAFLVSLGAYRWFFGHAEPVSSFVKRSWSAQVLAADPYYQRYGRIVAEAHDLALPFLTSWYHPRLLPLSLGLLTALVLLAYLALRWRRAPEAALLLAPWAVAVWAQHIVNTAVFHGGLRFSPWYYVVQPLFAALFLGLVTARLSRRWLPAAVVLASLPLALLVTRFWYQERFEPFEPLNVAADWSRQNLPADARLGAWNAGALSYYSERTVVNLDGLVNSWDFTERRHDLCRYWREEGITHIADIFRGREAVGPAPVFASYATCADDLELLWEDRSFSPDWAPRVYRLRP